MYVSAKPLKFVEDNRPKPIEYKQTRGNIIYGIWITWDDKIFEDRVEYIPRPDENYPLFGGHGSLKDFKESPEEIVQKAKANTLTIFFDEKLVAVPRYSYEIIYPDYDSDDEIDERTYDEEIWMFETQAKEYMKRFKELSDKYTNQIWFKDNLCEYCGGDGHITIQNQETGEAEDSQCGMCKGVGAYQHEGKFNVY